MASVKGAHDIATTTRLERDAVTLDPTLRSLFPDGRTEHVHAKKGDFMNFEEPWEHNWENNTDRDFEAIYIEVK